MVGHPERRGTLFVEDAEVIRQTSFPAQQFVLRVYAPQCARRAAAGSFAHITCDEALPMRRPLSIMRADADAGWIEFLFKIVGQGLAHLAHKQPGDRLSVLGPIGKPFTLHGERPWPLLIGGGVGIPPMVFLAETLVANSGHVWRPLVLMGSEIPFPFETPSSTVKQSRLPDGVTACMPLLDAVGIPCRLASGVGYPGSFKGHVTELAAHWLSELSNDERAKVEIFACGPTPMLKACAALARRFEVPAQVSLEEFMACAVGGCAGCVVEVRDGDNVSMQRVCVDGPVFDALQVFPAA